MMQQKNWKLLQLFAEGEGDTGTTSAGAGAAEQMGDQTAPDATGQNTDGQGLQQVVYGKQTQQSDQGNQDGKPAQNAAAQDQAQAQATQAEREKAYKQWKKDNKDLYDADVQKIVQGRLRNFKATQAQLDSTQPLLTMLKARYGLSADSDVSSIISALDADDNFFEAEATKRGMDVDTYRQFAQTERQNAVLQQQLQQQEADRIYQQMLTSANAVREYYPDFDLETELANPQFAQLLSLPDMDMKQAYEFTHRDEIIPTMMQVTAQKTAQRVADTVKSNRQRPDEGSQQRTAAAQVKSDPSKWSNMDLDEVTRRVMMGEKITL